MVRVKRGNVAAKRRKKYVNLAKGYVGSNSRLSTMAGEQVVQSLNFAYIGRKLKKLYKPLVLCCMGYSFVQVNAFFLTFYISMVIFKGSS